MSDSSLMNEVDYRVIPFALDFSLLQHNADCPGVNALSVRDAAREGSPVVQIVCELCSYPQHCTAPVNDGNARCGVYAIAVSDEGLRCGQHA